MIEDFNNIPQLPSIFGPAKQIAYVVDDIDRSMAAWSKYSQVSPFLVTRNAAPLSNAYYRGQRARTTRVNIAFAYIGDMQLELIEQIGDTPGLYKEAIDAQRDGVHHYAVLVEDFPSAYDWALDNSFDAVIDAGVDGIARMSYLERPSDGLILEVIEWNTMTQPYFNGIEKRVRGLDPSTKVQEFDLSEIVPKLAVTAQLLRYFLRRLLGNIKDTRRIPTDGI